MSHPSTTGTTSATSTTSATNEIPANGAPPLRAPVVDHPYAAFVATVQKPARYLGGEFGSVVKRWDDPAIEAKVCLGFPDVYDIGMSHLGLKILYSLLNGAPDILAERTFSPWIDMERELRARGLPLVSHESARPLREFDVVGISLQFELTYTNCLQILDLGGIPLRSADRADGDPLVVAGGPTATHPEPLAPFFDAFVIGDGEEAFPALIRAWTKGKREGLDRAARLRAIAAITGVYVPALYATSIDPDTGFEVVDRGLVPEARLPVRRAVVTDLNRFPFPADGPVPNAEAIFDRHSIEIARGCTEGCRFCQAGMIYRPVRERDPQSVIDTVTKSIHQAGYDEVALTSLSTADYSSVSPLVRALMKRLEADRVSLSVSSLRAYGLSEELLDEIQKVRATGLTFAPEAGTQRMRDVVNKNVTEAQLMETAERVFSRGWSKMKLYFMIGLPTERDGDVAGIVETGAKAQAVGRRAQRGREPSVTVSVSTFVPKPHTPFQWAALDQLPEIQRKQAILRGEAKRARVDVKTHDAEGSVLEGVLARGDRSVSRAIERAFRDGARFDSWEDQLDLERWQRAFDAEGIAMGRFTGTIPMSARLPWSHLDVGLEDGFLAREYRKALKDQLSPPCGKAAGAFIHHTNVTETLADPRKLVCYDCGVACDLSAMRDERLVYLRKLGAEEPVAPKVRLPRAAPEPGAPRPQQGDRKPKVKFVQGEARRYRLRFRKIGPSAFLSHLDLLRAIPRVFRRLELPLYYSQGFHPKPDMTFGPALSLGVASLSEFVDVRISADLDVSGLAAALTSVSADGLIFDGAAKLGPDDANVARVLGEGGVTRYAVAVPRSALPELGLLGAPRGPLGAQSADAWIAALRAEIEGQLEGGSLVVMRTIEGVGKKIDVRSWLSRVTVDAPSARAAIHEAAFTGDLVPIEVEVRMAATGGVKIGEVVEALLGKTAPYRAVRVGMWAQRDGRRIDPIDVAALAEVGATPELGPIAVALG
jgi:radical SAM family uncharacterized protein